MSKKQTTWADEDAELAATLAMHGYGPTALSELMHYSPKTIARMLAYKKVDPGRIKYRQRRWTTQEEAEYAALLHDSGMPAWQIAERLSFVSCWTAVFVTGLVAGTGIVAGRDVMVLAVSVW